MRLRVRTPAPAGPAGRVAALAADVLREPGDPLPAPVLTEMEARFRHDLARIRIHTGDRAGALAAELGARAATLGDDVVFAAGEYRPDTVDGRRLLAHEIAHAVQAGGAPVDFAAAPTPGAEAEARAAAAAATSGAEVAPLTPAPAPAIARFLASLPLRESAAPLAEASVEALALEIARTLERDPADASDRTRTGVDRLADATRAAVVSRVQELLTPAQRDAAAETLTNAVARQQPEPEEEAEPEAEAEAPELEAAPEVEAEAAPVVAPEPEPAPEAAAEEEPAAETAAEEAEPIAGAEPAAPTGEAGAPAPEGGAAEGAAPAAPTAGMAIAAPDEGPIAELEAEVDRRTEAATLPAPAMTEPEAPLAAAPGLAAAEPAPAEPAPPEPAAEGAEPVEPTAVEPSPDEGPEPSPPAGPEPSAPATGAVAEGEIADVPAPAPADVAPGAAAVEEPAPTPEELAVASAPEPPVTPELEAAVAEAQGPDTASVPVASPTAAQDAVQSTVGPVAAPGDATSAVVAQGGGADTTAVPDDAQAGAAAPTEAAAAPAGGDPAEGMAAGAEATGDCGPDVEGGAAAGAAIEAEPPAPVPDVSAAAPADAMGAIATLPPAEMGQALGGVGAAAAADVAAAREQLAAAPPQLERPAGSPETRPAGAAAQTATAATAAAAPAVERVSPSGAAAPPAPATLPPAPAQPAQAVAAPPIAGTQGQVTAADAQAIQASLASLPVTDPGLNVTAGPAPTVGLAGDADPQLAADQRAEVERRAAEAHTQAQAEAAQPLGEGDIYPDVTPGTITAAVPAATPAAPPQPVAAPDEVTAVIAREEHAGEVQAAAAEAQARMATDRAQHDQQVVQGRQQAQLDMDETIRANAEEQATARSDAQRDVAAQRGRWSEAQAGAVTDSRAKADAESTRATTGVEAERADADGKAAAQIRQGNEQAATAKADAERDARGERDRGKEESKGVVGWFGDQVRGFFDSLKRGLEAIFEAARAAVRAAIERAQQLAHDVIDAARKRIVALIKEVGDRLIAIADDLLGAFPALRDRFRTAITALVDTAVAVVNKLAATLEAAVKLALDALGTVIEGYFTVLETLYLAAVKYVATIVEGVLKVAEAVAQGLGDLAQVVVDIAPDPIRWLKNLGAAALDGLRNHLWKVVKCKVKAWFNDKVQSILGLGRMIFEWLRRGGINFAQIGRMVWEALKASLPGMVIQLAIEKLISLLVPAASALMLIIQGLRAAWGAMSRIIAAFQAFVRFLKAVKTGNAGREFAEALAAGAVALLDFLSNFLLQRMKGAGTGVAGRLSAMASKIAARLGKAVAAVRKVAVGAARFVAGLAKRAGTAVVALAKKAIAALAKRFPKVAALLKSLRARWLAAKAKLKKFIESRRKKKLTPEERVQRAITALRPRLAALLGRGVPGFWLAARLLVWRLWYGLRELRTRRRDSMSITFEAAASPGQEFMAGSMPRGEALRKLVRRAVGALLTSPDVMGRRKEGVPPAAARDQLSRTPPRTTRDQPVPIRPGAGFIGMVVVQRWLRAMSRPLEFALRWGRHLSFAAGVATWFMQHNIRSPGGLVNIAGRDYPAIAGRLVGIGGDQKQLASAFSVFVATGELAPQYEAHRRLLGNLGVLMFGIESQRSPMNLAMAPMMMQLIARGQLDFPTAFGTARGETPGTGGGAFPMSMTGAQAAGAELEREAKGQFGPRTQAAEELARREIKIAEAWLMAEMAASGLKGFADEQQAYRFIEKRLLEFYRVKARGETG